MIDATASLPLPIVASPVTTVPEGAVVPGAAASSEFALALTGLIAPPAALPPARQATAASGKSVPLAPLPTPGDFAIGDLEAELSLPIPGTDTPDDDPESADAEPIELPEARLEPALAWLLPPPVVPRTTSALPRPVAGFVTTDSLPNVDPVPDRPAAAAKSTDSGDSTPAPGRSIGNAAPVAVAQPDRFTPAPAAAGSPASNGAILASLRAEPDASPRMSRAVGGARLAPEPSVAAAVTTAARPTVPDALPLSTLADTARRAPSVFEAMPLAGALFDAVASAATAAPASVPAPVTASVTTAATVPPPGIDLTREVGLHRMIDQIEHLRDAADARDTRIRLIPDALGVVDIAVRRVAADGGERVQVHFTAAEAATRTLLAEAQPRLAELAEARGVRIDRASVDAGGGERQPGTQPQPQSAAPRAPAAARPTIHDDTSDDRVA